MEPGADKGGSLAGAGRARVAGALAAVAISSALAGSFVTYRVRSSRSLAHSATAERAGTKSGPGSEQAPTPAASEATKSPDAGEEVFSGTQSGAAFRGQGLERTFFLPSSPEAFPGSKSAPIVPTPGGASEDPDKKEPTGKP
ncbi:MAG: hypothetical protein ACK5Z4_02655 [Planctomyces sp.]